MTIITTTSKYIDGAGYFINDDGWLVADFCDDIPSFEIREVAADFEDYCELETELTAADIAKANSERKDAAAARAESALEGADGSYSWMLECMVAADIAALDDEAVATLVNHQAEMAYSYGNRMPEWATKALTLAEFVAASDVKYALKYVMARRAEIRDEIALNAVMTASEAAKEFGLAESTVRQTINREQLVARKSGGTWLILREHAAARWGQKKE